MSTTGGIFSQYERDELNKITAKSILEKLMNIRQKINVEFTARRLIWELIQNAKDNVSLCNDDEERVDVTIEITEDEFIFSHNKGYFTNEHIRGLIRKYSSSDKNRDFEDIGNVHKTTGRFGTGFMTTHLLSEKVQVSGYYKNDERTFNHFSFWLNREGKSEKDIIQGINNAFNEAEASIGDSQDVVLKKIDLDTSFTYPLSKKKKKLAEIALEEVRQGIAYTLINVPEINSINLIEDLIGQNIYRIEDVNTLSHQGYDIIFYNLLINEKKTKNYYVALKNNNVQIIVPVSLNADNYHASLLEETIPRLHLDFPMIGTEDLNLPFIINSPLFEPTEPRDGVSLINDDENEISQLNCGIVIQAVELYSIFLSYVDANENWKNLYNLARVKHPQKHSWIDYEWYIRNVVENLRLKLLHVKLVNVTNGERISIWNEDNENQVFFPHAKNKEIRNQIWELLKKIYPQCAPIKDHIDAWDDVVWSDCYKFPINELSNEIQNLESLENLYASLDGNKKNAIKFLNDYYILLNNEGDHIKEIIADEFLVIPNQLGEFKKKSELYIDKNIDTELKNVCLLLSVDPREYLLHKNAYTGDGISYHVKNQDDIISEINNIIKESQHDNISNACDYLASLFPKKNIPDKRVSVFNFSQKIYPDDFKEKKYLDHYNEKIWEESDKKSLFYIVSAISDSKTVQDAVTELGFDSKSNFIKWLDTFVTFLVKEKFENNINREKHPVLPNQNGVFWTKDNLFLDEGNIGDELKDISNELGYDFREELLDASIFLELPENRTYSITDVAEKISTSIKPILRDVDERKEYKETLKKFYVWMSENKELAEIHFLDLFEKRFLFLEDDDISQNMKKATEFEKLMEEHGIENIEDLRSKLATIQSTNNNDSEVEMEKINITKEILASLGISSQKDLEKAFKDPAIASRFYHTSTPTTAMFIYAQSLIDRAKENIKQHLISHPDYDCTDLEETATTTLVGILKKGIPVQIVTRPSDNGEVIVYYSSEKDTLDSDDSELWVDNGISEPHILTLGRILKSTGINRIPIKMN